MFTFQLEIMHIPKDNAFDYNNNVARFLYQVPLPNGHGLGWIFHVDRFRIVGKNLPKGFLNIVLTLGTATFVANVFTHVVQVKVKLNNVSLDHQLAFIILCSYFDKDAIILIFVHPPNSLLLNSITFDVSLQSKPKVIVIIGPSFHIVIDCIKLMSFAPHVASELREVNYNTLCIENVPYIPATFDGDVLFELPLVNNLDGHYGQMQGMDKKYDGHFWCKVKTTNIKNDFNLTFCNIKCLGHLEC
jgi:hypothetical protein